MCRDHVLVSLFGAAFIATNTFAGDTLPGQLGPWGQTDRKMYAGQTLYDYIDGGAEVYFEYGFSAVEVSYYEKGEQEILVEKYRMSSPQAAAGIYSFFKDVTAPSLPTPYVGKMHDLYLECLNGGEYVKIITYDSLSTSERLALLRDLVPAPEPAPEVGIYALLPEERLPDSEVYFNGPIALKNFCPLGRGNYFGVGERTRAVGCLVEIGGRPYKWVTLLGDSAQLQRDRERFLASQKKNDYVLRKKETTDLLEDQLSDKSIVMRKRGDRIDFMFGIGKEEEESIIRFIRTVK